MSKVKEFLNLYTNKSTKTAYKSAIISFVECIYDQKRKGKRITEKEKEYFFKLADNYFTEQRNHYEDLLKFAVSLNQNPPKTARLYFSTIKEFLAHNEIEFSQRQLKVIRLKLPKGSARTVENDMDSTVIRKIIEHEYGPIDDTFEIKGYGPADYFKIKNSLGAIGFINGRSSMFCDKCNRIRLSCDGKIKPCLYSTKQYNIKELVSKGESEENIVRLLRNIIQEKSDYNKKTKPLEEFSMQSIGG